MGHKPPRLLVFDLDGTLINSSLDLCHSVNAALTHVGRPTLPNHIIAGHIGDGATILVKRSLESGLPLSSQPKAVLSPQAITLSSRPEAALLPPKWRDPCILDNDDLFQKTYDFFLTYYRAHKLDNTRCYPGVLEALTKIRTNHPYLPMAVLTNKPVNPSREICQALGLAPFFFQNYGGNSFPTKKPNPEGLLKLIAEANAFAPGITATETVMIGDSDVDILTARATGARTLGCTYGLAPEALASANPDTTVNRPSQWLDALGLSYSLTTNH